MSDGFCDNCGHSNGSHGDFCTIGQVMEVSRRELEEYTFRGADGVNRRVTRVKRPPPTIAQRARVLRYRAESRVAALLHAAAVRLDPQVCRDDDW